MAYIYVPLLFSFMAYGVIFLLASDLIGIATNAMSLIIADEAPNFETEYNSVFVKDSVELQEDESGDLTVKRSEVGIAEYGDLYAYVRCTRIALDAPVYKGDDDNILKLGIGQNFASGQPGFGKLILLSGHNNTYFNALKNIELEDIIDIMGGSYTAGVLLIETSYGIYQYKVNDMKVVNAYDETAYDFGIDHEQLILYTCYPFDMLSSTPYRYFVYADLVSGPKFVD